MSPLPLNYVLMTTTKGHFGRATYQRTVDDLAAQLPLETFAKRIANVKVSSDSAQHEDEMGRTLLGRGFRVLVPPRSDWRHHDQSHQSNYLADLWNVFGNSAQWASPTNEVSYSLVTEDDMLLRAHDKSILELLERGIDLLRRDPEIVQVRIPRWSNEYERVNGLKAKHGLDVRATREGCEPWYFRCGDWSNNVYLCRTRDLRNALLLMRRNPNAFPLHSEHGLSPAMKYFSQSDVPFAIFEPSQISCYHIGTLPGEEDDPTKTLVAT